MKVKSIQKTTLIDYPDKIACTLFLFGCNFRCGFCHNPELILEDTLETIPEKEILDFLKKRKDYLDGICITGGEPLLSLDKEFLKQIKKLGYLIKIDTNGSYPERLKEFIDEKLVDYVAMDIKGTKEKYKEIINTNIDLNKIEKSIKLISGLDDYEFRITVLYDFHNQEDLHKIAEWLNNLIGKKPKRFCLQGFQNKGKLLDKKFNNSKNVKEKDLEELKRYIQNLFEIVEVKI